MKRSFLVEVKVNSFSPPRVYLGTRRVKMGLGSPRKGRITLELAGSSVKARLLFSAPARTNWSFRVAQQVRNPDGSTRKEMLLDIADRTDTAVFAFAEVLSLATTNRFPEVTT